MLGCSYLEGSRVRDCVGGAGKLESITEQDVKIGWELPLKEEVLSRSSDRYRFVLEILTLDKDWVPITDVLPSNNPSDLVIAEMRLILEQDHNPFQNKSRLGPGPRGGFLREKKRWRCSGSGYDQVCVGVAEDNKDQILRIQIDPEYKARYNHEYKRWLRNKRRRLKNSK